MRLITKEEVKAVSHILDFINEFIRHSSGDVFKIYKQGYCWHFAQILNATFPGGEVCWVAPYAHFVYKYYNIPIDIEGVYYGEYDYLIPEKRLGPALYDFMHIPELQFNATKNQINRIISDYEDDIHKEYALLNSWDDRFQSWKDNFDSLDPNTKEIVCISCGEVTEYGDKICRKTSCLSYAIDAYHLEVNKEKNKK